LSQANKQANKSIVHVMSYITSKEAKKVTNSFHYVEKIVSGQNQLFTRW
jgi:hypothetical protein